MSFIFADRDVRTLERIKLVRVGLVPPPEMFQTFFETTNAGPIIRAARRMMWSMLTVFLVTWLVRQVLDLDTATIAFLREVSRCAFCFSLGLIYVLVVDAIWVNRATRNIKPLD